VCATLGSPPWSTWWSLGPVAQTLVERAAHLRGQLDGHVLLFGEVEGGQIVSSSLTLLLLNLDPQTNDVG
jgi:hypothetical protein